MGRLVLKGMCHIKRFFLGFETWFWVGGKEEYLSTKLLSLSFLKGISRIPKLSNRRFFSMIQKVH